LKSKPKIRDIRGTRNYVCVAFLFFFKYVSLVVVMLLPCSRLSLENRKRNIIWKSSSINKRKKKEDFIPSIGDD